MLRSVDIGVPAGRDGRLLLRTHRLEPKKCHGRTAQLAAETSCCQSLTFKGHELVVFGFAYGDTMADYPGMSDNMFTIVSHAHAQFGFNASSS
jgi:hypothetical protein